jgi:asparagine synthase (glutamine-hydrolysing)
MCGIAGYIDFSSKAQSTGETVRRMSASMAHRGPDATGFYSNEQASLGHNRLSIIDLAACSNQPMADHTGRYHIVFNGEIYNYRQLRTRLHDYPFSTNGDTEVILAAYAKWGAESVQFLEGMFAFAIWDSHHHTLFLTRDRLGVKPLYYAESNGAFFFASEIRALLATGVIEPEADRRAISEFLQFQCITFPSTIIKDIQTLEAATWMRVSASDKVAGKYWQITDSLDFDFNDRQAVESQIQLLLTRSIEQRMVSDVPVAAFLSGGIDSSAVVGLMSQLSSDPVNTFHVAFNEKQFDESMYASIVAKKFKTNHHEIRLQAANFLDDLVPALDNMDSPSGDGVNSFVVSKAISSRGIKVALSGTGGDELFAGYPIFSHFQKIMKYARWWNAALPVRTLASALLSSNGRNGRLKEILRAPHASIDHFYAPLRQVTTRSVIQECTTLAGNVEFPSHGALQFDAKLAQLPLLSQLSVAEYLGYTQHTLLRDMDQMSMAVSLEVREPFFDHQLVKFALNVPDHYKIGNFPKQLLVQSLGNLLPPEIVHRQKKGFEFPWKIWMRNELKGFCEERIVSMGERDFINKKQLLRYWQRFLQNDPNILWMELWLFVVLEHWMQKNNVR